MLGQMPPSTAFRVAAAVLLVVGMGADVAPSCNCSGPEKIPMRPWQHCGAEGPRRLLVCAAPTECLETKDAVDTGGVIGNRVCTTFCNADADCAAMGSGFVCRTVFVHTGDYKYRSACAKPDAIRPPPN